MVRMREKGSSAREIAEVLGLRDICSAPASLVYEHCGHVLKPLGRFKEWVNTPEVLERIAEMRKSGVVIPDIAEDLVAESEIQLPNAQSAFYVVQDACQHHGFKRNGAIASRLASGRYEARRQIRLAYWQDAIDQRLAGATYEAIAKSRGITRQRVQQVMAEFDVKKPPRIPAACKLCGEPKPPSHEYRSPYCSSDCVAEARHLTLVEQNSPWSRHATVKLICARCGVAFERTNYHHSIINSPARYELEQGLPGSRSLPLRTFCSQNCYHAQRREEGSYFGRERKSDAD
jgi:hypothetical protein